MHWADLVADQRRPTTSRWRPPAIPATALACLIYTSGTGGAPKGVMLPHRSILSNCRGAFELMRPLRLQDEIYLSYLPLSHSYEHTVGMFFLPSIGTEIVYCPRRRASGGRHADCAADHPDGGAARAGGDPRPRAGPGGTRAAGLAAALFDRALAIGLKRIDGQRLTVGERAARPAARPAGARQGPRAASAAG